MIERFSKDDFEKALPQFINTGGERYELDLGKAKLVINSSVDEDGIARDTDKDSIRVFLFDSKGKFIITKNAKVMNYVTRVKGWEARLKEKIDLMIGYLNQTHPCEICGTMLHINRAGPQSKNPGRLFLGCADFSHHQKGFYWVEEGRSYPLEQYMKDHKIGGSILGVTIKNVESTIEVIEKNPVVFDADNARAIIAECDSYQMKVVNNKCQGASVIDAGAGSGKTKTIIASVADLIISGIHPSEILCVTFTRKGATEMRQRIAKAIWPNISDRELVFFGDPGKEQDLDPFSDEQSYNKEWIDADPIRKMLVDWVCTIHALCLRLLKASGYKLNVINGTPHEFQVRQIIKDALDEFKWKDSMKSVMAYIDSAIENQVTPRQSEEYFEKIIQSYGATDVPADAPYWLSIIYERYMSYMTKHKLVSFTMMQSLVIGMIDKDPGFAEKVSHMFKYILVDEAQDTDRKQARVLFFLASVFQNISFIGDVWQSLFRFRGAVPEIMEEEFGNFWSDHKRFVMPTNYRSSKTVVERSKDLIRNNYIGREQFFKDAVARDTADEGEPFSFTEYGDFADMSRGIAELLLEDGNYEDWYVLSRTRAECAAIHMALISAKVPAINLSGGLLFGASHIRKVLAYARLACNYNGARDDLGILREVANVASKDFLSPNTRRRHLDTCTNDKPWVNCGCPVIARQGIDNSAVRYYGEKSVEAAGSWDGIIYQQNDVNRGGYPTQAALGAMDLVCFVNRIEQFKDDALACINTIISDSVMPWLMHEEGISEGDDLAENGKQEEFDVLRQMIVPGMTVEQFLDDVDDLARASSGSENGCVTIGTVHAVKGGEKPKVIVNVTRMPITPPVRKEGMLPVGIPNTIEDERRIAYVAVTRAKSRVALFQSHEWLGKKIRTSQFVSELGMIVENHFENEMENEDGL